MLARPEPPTATTIVVLNDYCHINGGASRVAIDEAVALSEAGLNVVFVGANGPVCRELSDSPVVVLNLDQPELVEAARRPGVLLQGLWNREAARATAAILGALDPARTVVHLHGYTKALTTAPVRAATDRGFKVVCTLHDFFAACPNGAFFDYVENAPCERRALSTSCVLANCDKRNRAHKLYRTLRSGIQAWPGRFPAAVDAYISLSSRSAEILRPYLAADARLYPLENMIPMRRREPVRVGEGSAVLAVGRLDREKSVEILLEASRRAAVAVTFVGDGPLKTLVEQTPHCRVTGWVSPAEVEAELEHARCLAFPSLWYETYGLVVSEAAARGVPSIVSNICAPTERIRHGETGWIFPSGSNRAKPMKVITFDRELFRAECRRLGDLALGAFDPELVVGIRSGGYVVAEAMLGDQPLQSRRLLPITRRRSSSALKEKNGLARSVVKALPYAVTDRIRVLEHRMLTRRRGAQPSTPSRWEADPAEADALASALAETPAARVLVVDDALDTGTTLKAVVELLRALAPGSTVRSAVIVTTTADPVISADISLHNRVLGRFPWSHDFKN